MADTLKTMPVGSLSDVSLDNDDKVILYRDSDKGAYVITVGEMVEGITKVLTENDLFWEMANLMGSHNSIYRGKYLGDKVTDEQWAEIKAGTFNDMFIGDYWTINGFDWVIADFNYWLGTGNTDYETVDNHIVIVPSTFLYRPITMNSSNTTAGGYIGSEMYASGLSEALGEVNSAFGSGHILSHSEYLTNAVTSGYPSGGAWVDDRKVDLMNEEMVYGCPIKQQMCYGGTVVTSNTIDKSQLALFRLDKKAIIGYGNGDNGGDTGSRYAWWLRDVVSAAGFANVGGNGFATTAYASNAYGVRPCFAIY